MYYVWYSTQQYYSQITYLYRGVLVFDCTRQVYNLGNGGVPVHHDPVDGILIINRAKQEK